MTSSWVSPWHPPFSASGRSSICDGETLPNLPGGRGPTWAQHDPNGRKNHAGDASKNMSLVKHKLEMFTHCMCIYIYIHDYIYTRIYIHIYIYCTKHTCIALHYIPLHCITLFLQYITVNNSTLHYITSHCVALHCIALHYIYIYICIYIYIQMEYSQFYIAC